MIKDTSLNEWNSVMDINLTGTLLTNITRTVPIINHLFIVVLLFLCILFFVSSLQYRKRIARDMEAKLP